jgi:hypothetical protein
MNGIWIEFAHQQKWTNTFLHSNSNFISFLCFFIHLSLRIFGQLGKWKYYKNNWKWEKECAFLPKKQCATQKNCEYHTKLVVAKILQSPKFISTFVQSPPSVGKVFHSNYNFWITRLHFFSDPRRQSTNGFAQRSATIRPLPPNFGLV